MKKCDVVIALGFDVTEDGLLPDEGKSRVEKAVSIFKLNKPKKIIFTGNVSHLHKYKPYKTEAEAMRDYAVKIGIPEEIIICESASKNTYQNALYCKRIIKSNRWKSVLIITSQFQIERAEYIFNKVLGPKYQIDIKACKNRLKPEELDLIIQMEEIKSKKLHRKFWHKVVDPRNKKMNKFLNEYLRVRTTT